jgi:hypothetical protein
MKGLPFKKFFVFHKRTFAFINSFAAPSLPPCGERRDIKKKLNLTAYPLDSRGQEDFTINYLNTKL